VLERIGSRAIQVAKPSLLLMTRLTGLVGGGHVSRFISEDLAARWAYLVSPAARRAERSAATHAITSEECFGFSREYFGVGPVQHLSEITALLELARENGTRVVCEIGAEDAGTSVMFSRALQPDTLIVMDLYVKNRWRLRKAAPSSQRVCVLDGDTTHPLTTRRLQHKLKGQKIDLLLIDGDHRWRGVRQDFLTYRQFVRNGGLVAFHDICETTDPSSGAWAGDVPAFWRLVRSIYPSFEFVDEPAQQGLGIGVVRYDETCSVEPVIAAVTAPAPLPLAGRQIAQAPNGEPLRS
jgi:cephalosporin hydroxylase